MAVGMAGREGPRPASYLLRAPAPGGNNACVRVPKPKKYHCIEISRKRQKVEAEKKFIQIGKISLLSSFKS
jgi:hypothetical protein